MTSSVLFNSTNSLCSSDSRMNMTRKRSASCESAEMLVDVDSPCCSSNKRPRTPTKKSVRFDMSQNTILSTAITMDYCSEDATDADSMDCDNTVVDSDTTITHKDKSNLWFSYEDLQDIRLREANVVKIHRFSEDYMEEVASLLGEACSSMKATIQQKQAAVDIHVSTEFLAKSAARGLECQIMPCIRQRRKQVVATFLKSQTSLQQWKAPQDGRHFTPDFQQQALSEHYQKLARPAQLLAQLLAAGDARVAQME